MSSEVSTDEVISGAVFLIASGVVLVLLTLHCMFTRQDLFTETRSSVAHQRDKPQLTASYKLSAYLKASAITMFAVTTILTAISLNFWPLNTDCFSIVTITLITWKIALTSQYLTYILKLYQCYPEPDNQQNVKLPYYKTKTLRNIAISVIAIALTFTIVIIVTSANTGFRVDDKDGQYPFSCSWRLDINAVTITFGVLAILWDLLLSIGSIYFFSKPLDALKAKALELGHDKKYKQMHYTGHKYKVVVCVASAFTILWILFLLLNQELLASITAAIDFVVSMICLMLMTPYYANDKWYKNLCRLCIICDKSDDKYISKASGPHNKDNSITDTGDQLYAYFTSYVQQIDDNNKVNKVEAGDAGDAANTANTANDNDELVQLQGKTDTHAE